MTFNPNAGSQKTYNMMLPDDPQAIPQSADLRTLSETEFDLSPLVDKGTIGYISGVWCDNSANDIAITIEVAGTYQRAIFPAGSQGYLPLLAPNNPKFRVYCDSVPGIQIPIIFHNIPLLPWLTYAGGIPVFTPAGINLNVTVAGPSLSQNVITLTGGNDSACGVNDALHYLLIQNNGANSITVNLIGLDATSDGITILAGGFYEKASGLANAVNVAGTLGEEVICYFG